MPKTLRRQSRKNNSPAHVCVMRAGQRGFDRPRDMKADNDTEATAVRLEG
jgi:hypothetical protein